MPIDQTASSAGPDGVAGRQKLPEFVLRLFVTGNTTRSVRAIDNIRRICEEHLAGRYALEVVDVYRHPEMAKQEQIIAAPTLVKQLPLPLRRLVGDLSDRAKVLIGLNISPARAPESPA